MPSGCACKGEVHREHTPRGVAGLCRPCVTEFLKRLLGLAAGWPSGAMVARYTRALSGELAVEEF